MPDTVQQGADIKKKNWWFFEFLLQVSFISDQNTVYLLFIYSFWAPQIFLKDWLPCPLPLPQSKETFALGFEILRAWVRAPHPLRHFQAENRSMLFDSAPLSNRGMMRGNMIHFSTFSFLFRITWQHGGGEGNSTPRAWTNEGVRNRRVVLTSYLYLIHKKWKLASYEWVSINWWYICVIRYST